MPLLLRFRPTCPQTIAHRTRYTTLVDYYFFSHVVFPTFSYNAHVWPDDPPSQCIVPCSYPVLPFQSPRIEDLRLNFTPFFCSSNRESLLTFSNRRSITLWCEVGGDLIFCGDLAVRRYVRPSSLIGRFGAVNLVPATGIHSRLLLFVQSHLKSQFVLSPRR